MAEFTSEIKTIPHPSGEVFAILSDLNNLELAKDKLPQDKIKDFIFDRDSCTVSVDPVGNVRFVIIEREPNQTIKFEAEKIPFGLHMWIQLKEIGEEECQMKLTVKADLSPFLKPMLAKPLQQGLDKIAELLSQLPYSSINEQE